MQRAGLHLAAVLAVGVGGFVAILSAATLLTWRRMRALTRQTRTHPASVQALGAKAPKAPEGRSSMLAGMDGAMPNNANHPSD